jgi:hypothetical protein
MPMRNSNKHIKTFKVLIHIICVVLNKVMFCEDMYFIAEAVVYDAKKLSI